MLGNPAPGFCTEQLPQNRRFIRIHSLYGRTLRRTRNFKAHDADNRCQVGDTVVIAESRPISKDKHWVVQQILRRGTGEPVEIAEVEA